MVNSLATLRRYLGLGHQQASHLEKGVSTIGGIVSILGVMLISQAQLGLTGSVSIISSMGFFCVLLFAVRTVRSSQPWSVLGGHLVSA